MPIYEYHCSNCDAKKDDLRSVADRERLDLCEVCNVGHLKPQISAPHFALEGVSGDFPTATARWARLHEEETIRARKRRTTDPN